MPLDFKIVLFQCKHLFYSNISPIYTTGFVPDLSFIFFLLNLNKKNKEQMMNKTLEIKLLQMFLLRQL